MKRYYLKLARRAYRMLRHRRIRRIGWLNKLVLKLFERDLWRPCMRSVAVGLSIGLFCAMLPIPLQMPLAALCCLIGRGNIPSAVAACWISNPITQIPLMLFQEKIGAYVRDFIDFGWFEAIDIEGVIPFFNSTVNLANFTVGVILSAVFLGIIAYPIVFILYAIFHRDTPEEKELKKLK